MARGFEKPPRLAVLIMVVGAAWLIGGGTYAATRTQTDPLTPAEQSDLAGRAAAASGASASAAPPKPVLFLGDSYSAGAGASTRAMRWTTLVAKSQHWLEDNRAFGGTGYVTALSGAEAQRGCGQPSCPSYEQAIPRGSSAKPVLIVVSGGRNDLSSLGPDYAAAVARFFADLHAAFPDAGIAATSPRWDDGPAPATLADAGQAVLEGVESVGGSYLDIGQPLAGHPDLVASDGVHPNDAGHAAIAQAVEAAMTAAGVRL
jgi:acyl-CoA thioesterase I